VFKTTKSTFVTPYRGLVGKHGGKRPLGISMCSWGVVLQLT